jgi:hypothetical protein
MLKPLYFESKEMMRDVHTKNALLIIPFTVITGKTDVCTVSQANVSFTCQSGD